LEYEMRLALSLVVFCMFAACERGSAPSVGAGADSRRERGELLSLACQACHTLSEGQGHQVGPNLYGIFGRRAGTADGFAYSSALLAASISWTPAELDRWLSDPFGYLPGTTMAFAGYQSAEDRAALIGYLIEATGSGVAP
jgi:cytochrome c